MKKSNVKTVLGFSKEEGAEDLKIEPKIHVMTFWKGGNCFIGKNLLCF